MLAEENIHGKLKELSELYPQVKSLNNKFILVGIQRGFKVALGGMSEVEWGEYLKDLKENRDG